MVLAGFVSATNSNVLSGSIFEFVKRPSRISVGIWSDVAISAGNLYTFQIGDTVIGQNVQVFGNLLTTSGVINNGPKFPEDFLIQNEPALVGDRLILAITRGTGNISWAVIMTEVA